MHDRIRRFTESGVLADDSYIWNQRENYIDLLEKKMRLAGYVPHLDLNPDWSTSLRDDRHYDFKITWYGVFVGSDVSMSDDPTAFSDGKLIRIR